MLKIRWDIKEGRDEEFRKNQKSLCAVMSEDHPGVICYHVDYPSEGVSEWVEIYPNDDVFRAHLANEKGQGPLGAIEKPAMRSPADAGETPTRHRRTSWPGSEPRITERRSLPSHCIPLPTGPRPSRHLVPHARRGRRGIRPCSEACSSADVQLSGSVY